MIIRNKKSTRSCRGVAAVEFAALLPFLLILLLGVWEMGRLIQVHQILNNATREGARVAAQGLTIDLTNQPKEISQADVENTVKYYLENAGIDTTGMTMDFEYLNGDTDLTDPHEASKNQRYRVTTTIPYDNIRWTLMSMVERETLTTSVVWESLVDDPFQINTNLPQW